jgi:predicted phage tail protein
MSSFQSALLVGQFFVMIVTLGAVLVAFGRILERLESGNKAMVALALVVESLKNTVQGHTTQIALIEQAQEMQEQGHIHFHRRATDPKPGE